MSGNEYVVSVGMEVHAELSTNSKMFCRCKVAFGATPNTLVCPVCLGLPGALPVPNRAAIRLVQRVAAALNCTLARESVFHRKNYFYPDLPKGFQVSQYGETNPLGYHGWIEIPKPDGGTKRIGIQRVHLEEDTGKLMHLPAGGSGVDYNRAGVPLMEIVTAFPPDIEGPDEATDYLRLLRQTLLYLGATDGKMEQGSLRCEPNVSVRPVGTDELGTKSEIKNLNSFRAVELGVDFEARRHIALLESGREVRQETRGWNESTESTYGMRIKEAENDYRYFPDPDLVPMSFSEAEIAEIEASVPELPLAKQRRYERDLGLSEQDAKLLVADFEWARFFEAGLEHGAEPKALCNWMNSDFARHLNETGQRARVDGADPDGREISKIRPEHLAELVRLVDGGEISGKIAKRVLAEAFESGSKPSAIVQAKGLAQVSDEGALAEHVRKTLEDNPDAVAKFKAGKQNVIGFLVGDVMKKTQGRANPGLVQSLLRKELEA